MEKIKSGFIRGITSKPVVKITLSSRNRTAYFYSADGSTDDVFVLTSYIVSILEDFILDFCQVSFKISYPEHLP